MAASVGEISQKPSTLMQRQAGVREQLPPAKSTEEDDRVVHGHVDRLASLYALKTSKYESQVPVSGPHNLTMLLYSQFMFALHVVACVNLEHSKTKRSGRQTTESASREDNDGGGDRGGGDDGAQQSLEYSATQNSSRERTVRYASYP